MILVIPFICMIALLALGLPIAFSIGIAGMVGILLTGDVNMLIGVLGLSSYNSVASFIFTTVPMFILMAFLASSAGLAKNLFNAADKWFSHIPGGLAIGTIFACGVFGAMSGVSTAAASVMAKIAIPNMRRLGYSDVLSAGTVGVGATLDILIPPSVGFVIYGMMTETSIGKLLLAGIVPGIILGIFLVILITFWVILRPQDAPKAEKASWPERWRSLWPVWPSLILIAIVMVLLYTGICTPTEVGAIGAFAAGVLGVCFGDLNVKGIMDAIKSTLRITAMILMILVGTFIFGAFIALSGVPDKIIAAVTAMDLNRWVVIIGIVVTYFVLSMFMDELPLLILTVQLTFPLVMKLGFDGIWFGVISMIMVMLGLVFPPVGMLAFVVSSTGNVDLVKTYKGTSILMFAILLTLVVLMVYPEIALWLPSTMK